MKINQAKYTTSAVDKNGLVNDGLIQFAFVGRSNVGKSSLINSLVNQKKLAKTSSTPGLTKMVNYFLINNEFYFVDLPGYGFAKTNNANKKSWASVIESYLLDNPDLRTVFVLIDIRHAPTQLDKDMIKFLVYNSIPFKIIATKADKIAKSKIGQATANLAKELNLRSEMIKAISSQNNFGIKELLEFIESNFKASR